MKREISITMPRTNLAHHKKMSIIHLKDVLILRILGPLALPPILHRLFYDIVYFNTIIQQHKKPAFLLVSANSLLATTLYAARGL